MILDLDISYVLTPDSIARILCDSLNTHTEIPFEQRFASLVSEDKSQVEERVRIHLIKFGKLGIPTNAQLSKTFGLTESQAQAFVDKMIDHLESL